MKFVSQQLSTTPQNIEEVDKDLRKIKAEPKLYFVNKQAQIASSHKNTMRSSQRLKST